MGTLKYIASIAVYVAHFDLNKYFASKLFDETTAASMLIVLTVIVSRSSYDETERM